MAKSDFSPMKNYLGYRPLLNCSAYRSGAIFAPSAVLCFQLAARIKWIDSIMIIAVLMFMCSRCWVVWRG